MTALDEARREAEQAAAEALRDYPEGWCGDHDECLSGVAAAAVAAVWPVVERAVREQVAAEVRAHCCGFDGCDAPSCVAFAHAARIAAPAPTNPEEGP